MKTGLVLLGGPMSLSDYTPKWLELFLSLYDFQEVVAVDGGLKYAEKLGLEPTLILGDFDSISSIDYYTHRWPLAKVVKFPSEKSMTDAELAFEWMLDNDIENVCVLGGFGGRVDHMLANVFLMEQFSQLDLMFFDPQNIVKRLKGPGKWLVEETPFNLKYMSLVPLMGQVSGVSLSGVKYPLDLAKVEFGQTLGISNEITADHAIVKIEEGTCLLIQSSDKK
ncbi:thiamine diphosphokinase [Fusibacter tunisiensis]|nr:thiamine diphosphokinase [Fusibacter tunisiensis]